MRLRPNHLIFRKAGCMGCREDFQGRTKTLGQKGTEPTVTFAVLYEFAGIFGLRRLHRFELPRCGLAGPFDPRTVAAILDHVEMLQHAGGAILPPLSSIVTRRPVGSV